jgi:uncharacterized membrane-anchored protein
VGTAVEVRGESPFRPLGGTRGSVLVLSVSEASATAGIIVASIVVPLLILGVVAWFFWRASNRDRKENG